VPAKDDGAATPGKDRDAPRFHRPPEEIVQRTARRVVKGGRASFASQAAFRTAVVNALRREDPLAAIGGRRLRHLLVGVPGVRLAVRYRERPGAATPSECPVCGGILVPIHNRTLTGERIVLGRRCTRCDYWTHGATRVPVRYSITAAGIDGRPRHK